MASRGITGWPVEDGNKYYWTDAGGRPLPVCLHCGASHPGLCWKVREIEYRYGKVMRVRLQNGRFGPFLST